MAIRRRELHPDETFQTRSGRQIPVVSEEQYLAQLVDLGRFQLFAGGVITAVNFRAPTDLDGEMVTVGGVLEWKDRTDAKPQPEPESIRFAAEARTVAPGESRSVTSFGEAVEATGGLIDPTHFGAGDQVLNTRTGETFEVEGKVVHEEEPAPRAAEPAPPASSDGIADGLEDIDPNAEDDSEIPEHLRA
jgi:hypothetical protein